MADKKHVYPTNSELREMSQAERNDVTDALSEAGLDDGPEWDRVYKQMEKLEDW